MEFEIKGGNPASPQGFKSIGAHVGLKKEKKDLAMIVSDVPAVCAGVFTTNKVKAAPVQWDMEIIKAGKPARAILVNSGNANAATGEKGIADNRKMAKTLAGLLGIEPTEVLICSTGVIGQPMPIDTIVAGIADTFPKLGYGEDNGRLAAEAIMTTDTFAKTASVKINIGGTEVTLGGMCKGSGMIHPNMATMLSFVTTDCAISRAMLEKVLRETADYTYNMISIDGDQSTNDTLLIMANGMAGNAEISSENDDYQVFTAALMELNRKLAIDIARDGEGASHLITTTVSGAKTENDARLLARGVVSSSLFKAAIFGADANWGRVLCAMGYSGADFNPNNVSVYFTSIAGQIMVVEHGAPKGFDEDLAKQILSEKDIVVDIKLYEGDGSATAWGCDLTYGYVKINGDYRS